MSAEREPIVENSVPLDSLSVGQRAEIVDVLGEDAIAVRILEMGLVPGESVQLIGRAPLGDPLEFCVRGFRLSLRRSEARRVVVRLVSAQAMTPSRCFHSRLNPDRSAGNVSGSSPG